MNTLKLVLSIPTSVNALYCTARGGRRFINPKGKAWISQTQTKALYECVTQKWPLSKNEKLVAKLWVIWPDNRKRDVHNLEKILWDALEGIVYENDMYVLPQFQDFSVDKHRPRVEIEITKFEEKQKEIA